MKARRIKTEIKYKSTDFIKMRKRPKKHDSYSWPLHNNNNTAIRKSRKKSSHINEYRGKPENSFNKMAINTIFSIHLYPPPPHKLCNFHFYLIPLHGSRMGCQILYRCCLVSKTNKCQATDCLRINFMTF